MKESFFNDIHYFRIPVNHLEESLNWYTEILGFTLRFNRGDLAVLELKSGPLFVLVKGDEDSRGHFTINGKPEFSVGLTTSNIEGLHEYLKDHGVLIEAIQQDEGHSFFYFYDPSGNKLQVHN